MSTARSLPPHASARSRNGPHGVDTAWPRPSRVKREESDVLVTPLARGLSILAVFGPDKAWLGNREIALATGLPAPTALRLLRSLVTLGYLHHDEESRKYALAPAALALGYAAIVDPDMLRLARKEMGRFADATDTYVLLGARDRLDVIILETQIGKRVVLDLRLFPGMRMQMAYSLMGWTLLAILPEEERLYLQKEIERTTGITLPASIRRRMTHKIAEVCELGFGTLHGEWEPELACVAAPVLMPDRPPWVLGCVGRTARMAQTRIELELGPKLVATAQVLQAHAQRCA